MRSDITPLHGVIKNCAVGISVQLCTTKCIVEWKGCELDLQCDVSDRGKCDRWLRPSRRSNYAPNSDQISFESEIGIHIIEVILPGIVKDLR